MADPSKTEKPTSQKRRKTRQEGQVAKSIEINTAVVFIAMLVMFRLYGLTILKKMKWVIQHSLENVAHFEFIPVNIPYYAINVAAYIIWVIWPVVVVIVTVVIIANIAQVGWNVTWKPLKPNFKKLNVLANFKNKFLSKEVVVTLVKSLGKIGIATYIVYVYLKNNFEALLALQYAELTYGIVVISKMISAILFRLILFFIVLAVADFAYQKWTFEQSIKMTKEEVKEERKRSEGSPQVKNAIRRKQRQMSRSRMMAQVPKADVVVTNPVHVAVALQYDSKTMQAPVVVAKGAMLLAESIKEVAKENKIPIVENKPLAQALYKLTDIDDPIPHHLFNTVAEILSYVYKVSGNQFGLKNLSRK